MTDDFTFGFYDAFDDWMSSDGTGNNIKMRVGCAVDDYFIPEIMRGQSGGYMYFLPKVGFVVLWLQQSITETELQTIQNSKLTTAYISEGPHWLGFIRYIGTSGVMELVYDSTYYKSTQGYTAKQFLADIENNSITVATIDTDRMVYSNIYQGNMPKKFHKALVLALGDQLCRSGYTDSYNAWLSGYSNKSLFELWDMAKKAGHISKFDL